jgi:hypothetical protein
VSLLVNPFRVLGSVPPGLEGRLISVALQALRLGTSVVLDYGLWGRDERSALRWLARSVRHGGVGGMHFNFT